MLKLERVYKSYIHCETARPVLRDVSLHISEGEMCSIVGASGSGKSTLLNIMGLLDVPDQGSVYYQGLPVHEADAKTQAQLRNIHIGFVFQSFHLLPKLSALDNVGLPLLYRGMHKADRRREAARWLERVGLSDRADHRPSELSGGQRQRVAIARALVGSPRLILADEPTGNLDPNSSEDVLNLLAELNNDSGTSVVIVTHDPNISRRCHREVVVHGGCVSICKIS